MQTVDRSTGTQADDRADDRTTSPRRVRHEVRDGVAVVAFSAVACTVLTLLLLLLTTLAA